MKKLVPTVILTSVLAASSSSQALETDPPAELMSPSDGATVSNQGRVAFEYTCPQFTWLNPDSGYLTGGYEGYSVGISKTPYVSSDSFVGLSALPAESECVSYLFTRTLAPGTYYWGAYRNTNPLLNTFDYPESIRSFVIPERTTAASTTDNAEVTAQETDATLTTAPVPQQTTQVIEPASLTVRDRQRVHKNRP